MRHILYLFLLAGCSTQPAPPTGSPPAAGHYRCLGNVVITVDKAGIIDNGDNMNCRASLKNDALTLDCHGNRRTAKWHVNPDKSIETDLIDRLYGEHEAVSHHCTFSAAGP